MVELFANSGDYDQMPLSAASDLALHCLPVTRLGVSSLQWVKVFLNLIKSINILGKIFSILKSKPVFLKKKNNKKKK